MRHGTEGSDIEREVRTPHMSDWRFTQLTEKLIYVATANRTFPSEALAALAKALGTLLAFTARREGLDKEALLSAVQTSVADYMIAAAFYISENADTDPATSFTEQS